MKRLILILAVVAMLLPSCKKINEAIDGLDSRLDKLEQETIPSIDEQISAINTTLGNLDAMDKGLKGYIDNLTTTASSLQEQINATNIKIDEVKAELKNEITSTEDELKKEIETTKANVIAQLEAAKEAMENELAQINSTIETLKAKDAELDNKIAELRSYVDTELGDTTDWVNATFATLEQYNALVSEVATIKEQIKAINQSITELETRLTTKINEDIANAVSTLNADIQQKVSEITSAYTNAVKTAKEEITAAYTSAIQNAINALDASLKAWVGEQLANYYTIAEVEAKITALNNSITNGDADLQQELNTLKEQLTTTANEITEAYKKAIEEAITTNNGEINTKIANEIASVNQRITNEVATINAKIAEIESRLDNVEAKIAELLARIQSVSYIPTYDDGKVTVKYNGNTSRVTLDFEVSPKDAVVELAKVWQSAVSVKAIYTQTRAVSFIDMPIISFEADATNGVISVTASGENLSAEFFNGTQSASARLSISDGNNSVVSEYVPMVAKEVERDAVGIIPNNEIWYTSRNDNVVTPYATNAFNANIVSNTYDAEKECWVIKFDSDVTKISYSAFYYCSSLTSVTIPDSVTTIGDYAFHGCYSLTSVTIGKGVTSIGEDAFYSCDSLTSVYITDIAAWCNISFVDYNSNPLFEAENLYLNNELVTDLIIPDSVTSIGSSAFCGCTSLTSITIPDSVTSIGYHAFNACDSLTSVIIGKGVTSIGNGAFFSCDSLRSVYITDIAAWCKISFVDDSSNPLSYAENLYLNNELVTDLIIPDGATKIGSYAFYGYDSLTSVTIPDSVTSIGESAFSYCDSLTSVTIGKGVTSIGNAAFYNCDSLTKVYCKPITPPMGGSLMFNLNASGRTIYVPSNSVSAYKSASRWSDYASAIVGYDFAIDETLQPANNEIWYTNGSTTEATIPYETYAFGANIRSNTYDAEKECWVIKFDGNVTKISYRAFYYCSSLTSVTIPDSVTTIGDDAFYYCYSLTSVTIPDSVTTIGDSAFQDCTSLTSVTIPDSVTSIGDDAFYRCTSLTSVTIPDSVTSIGSGAFNGCTSLTSVTIPDSVTSIGGWAFCNCTSLTSITIPDSVTSIGDYAFRGCTSLTSITIPDSVTTIGSYAICVCDSLTSVTIGNGVTSIGDYAFGQCTSLTSVTIGNGVTTIGENAFYWCTSLTSVTIPDSVAEIGGFAFMDCDSLTSVIIPDSVTTIGSYAFYGCDSLTKVYCKPITPPMGGYEMFDVNASGRTIYVPRDSVEAYKSASKWSAYADSIVGYVF